MNCFRYLNIQSLEEVDKMTLKEYGLRMKAFGLQRLDREHDLHKQAYLNLAVQATKQQGNKSKPVYPTFKSFFDYEKHLQEVTGERPKENKKQSKMQELILKANTRGGQDEQ